MTDATVVVVKDNYEELLQQFAALKVSRDNESLRRCFQFGKLYTEFYDSCGTAKYGGRRVGTLIKGLVEVEQTIEIGGDGVEEAQLDLLVLVAGLIRARRIIL